jgi:hypothetical protein
LAVCVFVCPYHLTSQCHAHALSISNPIYTPLGRQAKKVATVSIVVCAINKTTLSLSPVVALLLLRDAQGTAPSSRAAGRTGAAAAGCPCSWRGSPRISRRHTKHRLLELDGAHTMYRWQRSHSAGTISRTLVALRTACLAGNSTQFCQFAGLSVREREGRGGGDTVAECNFTTFFFTNILCLFRCCDALSPPRATTIQRASQVLHLCCWLLMGSTRFVLEKATGFAYTGEDWI